MAESAVGQPSRHDLVAVEPSEVRVGDVQQFARNQGLDHFGLTVKDIDAVAAEIKAKGVEFTKPPTTIRPGVRICFIRGPQGISIELLERDTARWALQYCCHGHLFSVSVREACPWAADSWVRSA